MDCSGSNAALVFQTIHSVIFTTRMFSRTI